MNFLNSKEDTIEIRMSIRDMEAEFELEAEVMAEPDEDGVPCILVVECE